MLAAQPPKSGRKEDKSDTGWSVHAHITKISNMPCSLTKRLHGSIESLMAFQMQKKCSASSYHFHLEFEQVIFLFLLLLSLRCFAVAVYFFFCLWLKVMCNDI